MAAALTPRALTPEVAGYMERFAARRGRGADAEMGWLRADREAAIAEFARLGFPSPREEAWRYTNVAPIARRRFDRCPEPRPEAADEAVRDAVHSASHGLHDSHRLVFVNGRFCAALSSLPEPGGTAVAQSLASGLAGAADTLKPYLGQRGTGWRNGFSALNAAFMADGGYLRIPAHTALEIPLHLVFVTAGASSDKGHASYPRNLIVAEAGSSAVVIESYVSADTAAHLTNGSTQICLDPQSRVEHYQIQQDNDHSYWVNSVDVAVGGDASYTGHALGLGSRLGRCDINVCLNAPGGHCALHGLYVADERRHLDYHTTVEHRAADCRSTELYKGILDGRGRAVFNGRVVVLPGAQRTDARQENHNLLLSRNAEIDTKPQLEIYADDVKCSHGATVGQLDDAMLFYLRSRGIDEGEARALLTFAFAREVLEQMGLPGLERQSRRALARVLPAAAPACLGEETLWETHHDP